MSRLAWAVLPALLMACPPPPEIDVAGGQPGVQIAYPPSLNEAGDGPFEVARDSETGNWNLLIVVDVENHELVDPYDGANSEPREGQGHWHLDFGSTSTPVPGLAFAELTIPAADQADGSLIALTAVLKQNDHSDLLDEDGNTFEDTVEVRLVAAE